jgi:hypothetical protein
VCLAGEILLAAPLGVEPGAQCGVEPVVAGVRRRTRHGAAAVTCRAPVVLDPGVIEVDDVAIVVVVRLAGGQLEAARSEHAREEAPPSHPSSIATPALRPAGR